MPDKNEGNLRRLNISDDAQRYPLEKMTQRRRRSQGGGADKAGRVPPQAVDVEKSVLGAMLIEREAIPRAIEILPADSFYANKHQKIYEAVRSLFGRGNPVDLITLTEELKRRGELDTVGGPYYLTELTTNVASAANVEYHARIIAEKSLLRRMIETMTRLVGKAYDAGADAFDLMDEAESDILSISDSTLRASAAPLNDVIKDTVARLQAIHGREGGITGVPSGFRRLDDLTSGWQKSDLIIIAARPSMGKCLGKGTPMMMCDGTVKPVEEVAVGDQLMGDDGTPRAVQSLARGREPMYWVRQKHGMDYRVNASHILSLKKSRRGGRRSRGSVTDLPVHEWLAKSAKWKNDNKGFKAAAEFPEQPVPLDPYFLGLWLGDGKSDHARIYTTDEEVVAYLHDTARARGETISVYDTHRPCPAYLVKSGEPGTAATARSVQAALRTLGVLCNKHIPHLYVANSRKRRLQLLAGLIDSDGHLNRGHGGTYEITQSNRRLAEQIKFLCDTLGYRTSLKEKQARITSIGFEATAYRVRFNGNVDEIPVRVARKKATPWTDGRDWRVTGINVEPDGVGDYYGFTLDGNGRFLLADGTVTHNTAFSLATALNAATHPERATGVAIFSLEMGAQQLAQRLLTSEARVNAQAARTGRMTDDDWQRLARAAGTLSEANVFIDDTPGLSILELRAKCRRLKAEHDIGLVVVDYLQLMHGTGGGRTQNREQEIAQISRSLKGLAKELNVPVLALSQLNRGVETRGGDKRPQLSDLRESGCLTGETLIPMADSGKRVPIRELAGRSGLKVWALDPDTLRLRKASVSRAFSTGTKPVFKITTRLGRTIRATANHKFRTPLSGWQRLDALKEGQRMALPRTLSQPEVDTLAAGAVKTLPQREDLRTHGTHALNASSLPPRRYRELRRRRDTLCTPPLSRGGASRSESKKLPSCPGGDTGVVDDANAKLVHGTSLRIAGPPAVQTPRNGFRITGDNCTLPRRASNLSRERAQRVAQVVGSAALARLAQNDVYWDEIVSIEPDGVEEVFDLTIPGPHNFVANGIIAHNSIEQDADIVAFIYRAERYGITVDENGNSTEGIAEIIIEKQRNGPTGSVELAFVNQYALFENLTTYYNEADQYSGGQGGPDDFEDGGADDFNAPQPPPDADAPF